MSFHAFASSSTPDLHVPLSPIPTYRTLQYDSLQDDIFDSSFSFINPDYFASAPTSPSPGGSDLMDSNIQVPSQAEGQEEGSPNDGGAGSSTAAYPIPMASLTIVSPPPHQYDYPANALPINYSGMPFSAPSSTPHHSMSLPNTHGFHPYHQATLRSARLSRSPDHAVRPISPGIPNFSPSGSFHHNHSPSAVSPSLVSPASVLSSVGSLGSDGSPHWGYSLPSGPSMYAGTPVSSMTNLSTHSPGGPGLSMVAGFPYPTSSRSPRRAVPPVPRPKPRTRANTTSKMTKSLKREPEDEDVDADGDASMSDDEEEVGKGKTRGGLGLSPATNTSEDVIKAKNEPQIKAARIQSEQRRRDELREGFNKLREVLPQSNLRASKVSVLDRSVSHIQQTLAANHYLMKENDTLKQECERLRKINESLSHALATQTRANTGSSPESTGRAPPQTH